jgi:hypothetical protein
MLPICFVEHKKKEMLLYTNFYVELSTVWHINKPKIYVATYFYDAAWINYVMSYLGVQTTATKSNMGIWEETNCSGNLWHNRNYFEFIIKCDRLLLQDLQKSN